MNKIEIDLCETCSADCISAKLNGWYNEDESTVQCGCYIGQEKIELCTFPDDDKNYCISFEVPKYWLLMLLERLDSLNSREGVDLPRFLDNYVWDETWFIYQQAKLCDMILKKEKML